MRRPAALALLVAAALLLSGGTSRRFPIAAAGGGGHTDFTATVEFCWILGTSSGTDAGSDACSTGGASNATIQGSPSYVSPPAGSETNGDAVDMNGGADMIVADSAFGTESNTLSMGGWFLDEGSDADLVLHKGSVTFLETTAGTDQIRARSSASMITPGATMGTAWHHYVMTISATTTRLYIDGVEDCGGACPTDGSGHADNSTRFTMGANDTDSGIIPGALYEVFYDDGTVLTASQICSIAKWGLDGTQDHTSLVSCTE